MNVSIQQIYVWALGESERADICGRTRDRDCAAGAARLADACLSDSVILDRLKAAAARRAEVAKAEAAAKAESAAEAKAEGASA